MSSAPLPIQFDWDGEAMWPRHQKVADRWYVVGESYWLEPHEPRSFKSHGHYFACVNEAWKNLPEQWAERFATSDHLRKWALIKAGYRDERTFVCASKAEALRLLAFVKATDEFAVYRSNDAVVIEYKAKSQSQRAMGRKDFQASKDAVLDVLAEMIGVDPSTLGKNAGQAA